MNPADPHRSASRLSERLKHLDDAQGPLAPAPFDLDDVVRGGRRRHRRRTVVNATAAAAAVVAVVTAVALGPFGGGGPGRDPVAGQPSVATPSVAPSLPPVDATDPDLEYKQRQKTVTATLDGAEVAGVTLKSWSWSGTSGSVVLTVVAARPFTIAPEMFNLTADDLNENSPANTMPVTVPAGTRDITLDFEGPRFPGALIWLPQAPEDDNDNDDGIAATWPLTAADRN
jgi:hypothetical protein